MLNRSSAREPALWWLVFALGFALSIIMALRSQIGGDQRLMLELGWSFIANGEWLPYGMPTSAGGRSPGGLMGLFMAIPLWLWRDYRAPAVFTALLEAAAFLLLTHHLRDKLTKQGMWLLLLFVWLGPWRMYFSAHIWNSSLMFIIAVLHLLSAQRMAQHREAWNSCWQVVLIALAMQLHTSAFVLGVLSLLLLWRGMIKVHWGGFAVGIVLGIASYLPWLIAMAHEPTLAPGNKGFFLRGLLYVFPLVRGLLYWIKMPTLAMASRMEDFDFTSVLGASANTWLVPLGATLTLLSQLTMLPAAWANWHFFRRMWPILRKPAAAALGSRAWLQRYVAWSLVAAVFCFAISPTTVMFWQVFISIPAAALVLIMSAEGLLCSKLQHRVLIGLKAWSVMTVLMLLCQALAAPQYRCGGRDAGDPDEMLRQLHVPTECRNQSAQ